MPSPLVLVGHGSADPRFAAVVEAIAARVRGLRPELDVRVGFLDHGPPALSDVVEPAAVVVPLLLSAGHHVRVDVPGQTAGSVVTDPVGPDPLLAAALAERLGEAGYDGSSPVTLAAAGSADTRALADVRTMAGWLADRLGAPVHAAFVSAGQPRVTDVSPRVVATYLVAPGAFHDALRTLGADVVSEPLGDHPAVAAVVLDRYDRAATDVSRRARPDPA